MSILDAPLTHWHNGAMNPDRPPSALPAYRGLLLALVLANVLPELVLQMADRGIVFPQSLRLWVFAYGAFQPDLLSGPGPLFNLQPVTMFFTYGFVHTGLSHLVINMLGLIWLGRMILSYRTTEAFLLFYLMSMVGAAELFALIGPEAGATVGASGALFGLLGVYAIDAGFFASNNPARQNTSLQFFRVALATAALALSDLASQYLIGSMAAWQAHTGGFLTGAVVALLSPPRYRTPA